jgi:hypothetical protein
MNITAYITEFAYGFFISIGMSIGLLLAYKVSV